MGMKPIRSGQDYQGALSRINEIFQEPIGTTLGDERDVLCDLVELYELKHYPIGRPDPGRISSYEEFAKALLRANHLRRDLLRNQVEGDPSQDTRWQEMNLLMERIEASAKEFIR